MLRPLVLCLFILSAASSAQALPFGGTIQPTGLLFGAGQGTIAVLGGSLVGDVDAAGAFALTLNSTPIPLGDALFGGTTELGFAAEVTFFAITARLRGGPTPTVGGFIDYDVAGFELVLDGGGIQIFPEEGPQAEELVDLSATPLVFTLASAPFTVPFAVAVGQPGVLTLPVNAVGTIPLLAGSFDFVGTLTIMVPEPGSTVLATVAGLTLLGARTARRPGW